MTIRARSRRARPYTAPRAVVREYPTTTQEFPVDVSRRINSPAQLATHLERCGVPIRPTAKGGWVVRGDDGTATIPRAWNHGAGRDHVLRGLRQAGVDLSGIEPDSATADRTGPTPGDMPPKLSLPGPRPTPSWSGVPTAEDTDMPDPEQPEHDDDHDEQPDVDTLLSMLSEYAERLDRVEAELARLTERVGATAGPTVAERSAAIRDAILAWFGQLPAGMRVPAGVVCTNMCGDDETDAAAHRRQIGRLVELGQLVQHGGNPGARGGSHASYSLPAAEQPDSEQLAG